MNTNVIRAAGLIVLALSAVTAKSQFFTVVKKEPLPEICGISDRGVYDYEQPMPSRDSAEAGLAEDSIPVGCDDATAWAALTTEADSARYWAAAYFSVCPPLRELVVTSPYGKRVNPTNKGKSEFHRGVDFRANAAPAMSMMAGKVEKVGSDKRSGVYVVLKHGDIKVSYCHLSKVCVKKGDVVSAGDVVGITGNTGRSTGPHLHLRTKLKGKDFDPRSLIAYVLEVRRGAVENLVRLGLEGRGAVAEARRQ